VFGFIAETFDQYDYGRALNMQHYNSTEPPSYNLKSIQVPITLIYGENDILAVPEVRNLKKKIFIVIRVFFVVIDMKITSN